MELDENSKEMQKAISKIYFLTSFTYNVLETSLETFLLIVTVENIN